MAVVGVAATVSALAQNNVYSVNAVGYVNVTLPPGFTILANPLNATSNNLATLFPSVPLGTRIFKYNAGSFQISTFNEDDFGNSVWEPDRVLNPGEGVFFQNNRSTNITVTFVGEVPQGTALANPIPAGFSLKASIVPQAGQLDTTLGFTNVALGDRVFKFNRTTGGYAIDTYEEDDFGVPGWSNPANATIGVAEGFWFFSGAAKTWTRNFSATN
jgi:hypothetical protein